MTNMLNHVTLHRQKGRSLGSSFLSIRKPSLWSIELRCWIPFVRSHDYVISEYNTCIMAPLHLWICIIHFGDNHNHPYIPYTCARRLFFVELLQTQRPPFKWCKTWRSLTTYGFVGTFRLNIGPMLESRFLKLWGMFSWMGTTNIW